MRSAVFIRSIRRVVRRAAAALTVPRPATLIAYLALTVAMSGVAYAAGTIGSADIIDNSIKSIDLKDGAGVTGVDVVDDSLTGVDVNERTLAGVARNINVRIQGAPSAARTTLIAIGGYTIQADCLKFDTSIATEVWVDGSGTAQLMRMQNKSYELGIVVGRGTALTPGTAADITGSFSLVDAAFIRSDMSVWLAAPTGKLVHLEMQLLLDNRTQPGSCSYWGSATKTV